MSKAIAELTPRAKRIRTEYDDRSVRSDLAQIELEQHDARPEVVARRELDARREQLKAFGAEEQKVRAWSAQLQQEARAAASEVACARAFNAWPSGALAVAQAQRLQAAEAAEKAYEQHQVDAKKALADIATRREAVEEAIRTLKAKSYELPHYNPRKRARLQADVAAAQTKLAAVKALAAKEGVSLVGGSPVCEATAKAMAAVKALTGGKGGSLA